MTAVVKKIGEKKGFEIPTIEEVKAYMKERKGWPEKFLDYYAEKFWCHYQSNGWKVSGKAAMKDWRAAFVSQWQTPKFKEDIEFLNECKKTYLTVVKTQDNYLNQLLAQYKRKFESVSQEMLVAAYDYMKERRLLKLTKEEKELIVKTYGNNIEKGKAACVITVFNNMINYGKQF